MDTVETCKPTFFELLHEHRFFHTIIHRDAHSTLLFLGEMGDANKKKELEDKVRGLMGDTPGFVVDFVQEHEAIMKTVRAYFRKRPLLLVTRLVVESVKHTYAPCGKELPLPRHSPNAIRSHKRRRVGTRRETSKAAGDCPVCTDPLDLTGGDGFFMPPCGNSGHASCMRCAY